MPSDNTKKSMTGYLGGREFKVEIDLSLVKKPHSCMLSWRTGCFINFRGCKVSFPLSYSFAATEWATPSTDSILKSFLCFLWNVTAKLSAFRELLRSFSTFSPPMPSSASSFTQHCAAPWKTCAIHSLWVLTEAFLRAWETPIVLFPGLPPTYPLGLFSSSHVHVCMS